MANKIINPKEHYLLKVDKQKSGCWIWKGKVDACGYGALNYFGEYLAHRLFYKLFINPNIKGSYVLHSCDNPSCVNPEHLFLGSQNDNMKDMVSKGRQSRLKGSRNGRSKLTLKDVIQIRKLAGKEFQKETALKFNVTQMTISNIQTNKTWI
jgi:hypothetical protein